MRKDHRLLGREVTVLTPPWEGRVGVIRGFPGSYRRGPDRVWVVSVQVGRDIYPIPSNRVVLAPRVSRPRGVPVEMVPSPETSRGDPSDADPTT